METKVNEHLIRVSTSLIPIDTSLTNGSTVRIYIEGDVTSVTDKDLQDGTVDRIYTVKGITGLAIEAESK